MHLPFFLNIYFKIGVMKLRFILMLIFKYSTIAASWVSIRSLFFFLNTNIGAFCRVNTGLGQRSDGHGPKS